jgi:hypothetical protein
MQPLKEKPLTGQCAVSFAYRRPAAVLMSAALLAGCAGLTAATSARLLQEYVDCNAIAAERLAHSATDPVLLAIEAEGSCSGPRVALERAYRSSIGTAQAAELIDNLKRTTVASNAAAIVIARARG